MAKNDQKFKEPKGKYFVYVCCRGRNRLSLFLFNCFSNILIEINSNRFLLSYFCIMYMHPCLNSNLHLIQWFLKITSQNISFSLFSAQCVCLCACVWEVCLKCLIRNFPYNALKGFVAHAPAMSETSMRYLFICIHTRSIRLWSIHFPISAVCKQMQQVEHRKCLCVRVNIEFFEFVKFQWHLKRHIIHTNVRICQKKLLFNDNVCIFFSSLSSLWKLSER